MYRVIPAADAYRPVVHQFFNKSARHEKCILDFEIMIEFITIYYLIYKFKINYEKFGHNSVQL